ncbi:MAG TPA: glyoxalase/bleomycin resistance/dioxygenase family protein, partial [Gammaproteobacteria bacterium]|nr:glyoxalase/bleomycin resistance/dioxygenase family protein [Gammaproteobacteria bacterium]
TCCYANSEKSWIFDPDAIAWETFLTRGESAVYGSDSIRPKEGASACCSRPQAEDAGSKSGCC